MTDMPTLHSATTGLFEVMPLLVGLIFALAIGSFIFKGAVGVAEWSHNNSLPVSEVLAKVVAKRVDVKIIGTITTMDHVEQSYSFTVEILA